MTDKKKEVHGVFTPMVTPFKEDRVLFHGLIANVEKMNETALAGYFVLGTNGEYKSLSVTERLAVLKDGRQNPGEGQGRDGGHGFRKHTGNHRDDLAGGR